MFAHVLRTGTTGLAILSLLLLSMVSPTHAQRTRLVIGHWFIPGSGGAVETYARLMNDFIREFQELHPEIEVVNEPYQYGILTDGKMLVQLAIDDAPTVWLVPNVYALSFSGFLLELTDRIETSSWVQEDFIEPVLRANQDPQGKIWGFPQGLQLVGLYYHTSRFEERGVAKPSTEWTWDDFAASARKLTRITSGNVPEYHGAAVSVYHPYSGYSLFRAFGGQPFDSTGTRSTLHSDAMLQAIEFMKAGLQDQSMILGGSGELRNVAMGFDQYVARQRMQELGVPFDVTAVPSGPHGRFNPVVANSWVITRSASPQEQDAAWKWIEYYSSPPVQIRWAVTGDAAPANMKAAQEVFLRSDVSPPGLRDYLKSMEDADWLGVNPVWADWYPRGWRIPIEQAVRGEISPTEAMIEADHVAQLALDRYYKNQ